MFGWIKLLFGIEKAVAEAANEAVKDLETYDPVVEVEQPDFNKMTKAELETWAKETLGLDVDRRRKKDFIIETIKTKLKEK